VFQEVVDYYDRHGNANERMKAYYLMGCIYRDRHEAPMALQWYLDAVEQADTLDADCDYLTLMKVYGQMAGIYHSQLMPMEEIESRKMFSKCAEMMDSTYYVIRGIEKQLDAYSILGDTTMTLALTDSVHDLYQKAGMPQAASSVYYAAIYIYLARHDYSKAKQLMDIFEHESGLFDAEGNISKGREHYYCAKGAYYKGVRKLDSAEYYYRKLLTYNYDYNAYKGLLQLFELRHQSDSIIKYNPYFEAAHNAEINHLRFESTLQVQSLYNYSRNQKIASQKEVELIRRTNLIIYIIIGVAVLLVLLSVWYNINQRAVREALREKDQLQDEAENLRIELEKLKDDHNLFKTNKDQYEYQLLSQIQDLENQVSSMSESTNQQRQEEDDSELMESEAVKFFLAKAQGQYGLGKVKKSELTQLSKAFKTHLPHCYHKLTHHKLSEFELQVAFLTRLNLSTGDIAAMLDASVSNISNTKARANRKLFNQYSGDTLYKNMLSINSAFLPKPS